MTRAHVDTRLLNRLTPSFFNSQVTIQAAPVGIRDSVGQPVESFVNVAGLVDLPCGVAAVQRMTFRQEQRLGFATVSDSTHRILISGDYSDQITTRMRASIDGQIHDILSVDLDSQGLMTRLFTRIQSF